LIVDGVNLLEDENVMKFLQIMASTAAASGQPLDYYPNVRSFVSNIGLLPKNITSVVSHSVVSHPITDPSGKSDADINQSIKTPSLTSHGASTIKPDSEVASSSSDVVTSEVASSSSDFVTSEVTSSSAVVTSDAVSSTAVATSELSSIYGQIVTRKIHVNPDLTTTVHDDSGTTKPIHKKAKSPKR
jgi:hypothetical protein